MFFGSSDNRFRNNIAERNAGWGFLADIDSQNDGLTSDNAAFMNGAGQFGEVDPGSIDNDSYTDITDPWDCRQPISVLRYASFRLCEGYVTSKPPRRIR